MEISGKKVLVTGGAGFIGSHIVDMLLEEGAEEVRVYDNFSSGYKENLPTDSRVKIIEGDILDIEKLRAAAKGVDIISHHAAELEVFTGIENMHHDMRTNIEGTLNVLNVALSEKVKKVIYASSGAVYGQAQYLPEPETHPLNPHWPYGVSKLAGERYMVMAWLLYGLPTVSLRYGIVYGPREWYGRVLTLFIKRVLDGLPPVIFGDGLQTRDYVYISDVVEANKECILNDDVNGEVFNIGSGKGTSIKELAHLVCELINPKIQPLYDNPPEGKASKYQPERKRLIGELRDFVLDITHAREKIGYVPKVELKEGISREVEWLKKHMARWNVRPRV